VSEILGELLRIEQSEDLSGRRLEEDYLARHVEERRPAQPVSIEGAGRVEVRGCQRQEMNALVHPPIMTAKEPVWQAFIVEDFGE
jgi:hypothetical protein